MATKKKTIVNFILDKSGSMSSVQDATISGFNEYVGTLKKDAKSDYEFTLTLFDTETTMPYEGVAISKVKDLDSKSYVPNGNTALYDAVCRTIKGVKATKGQKVLTIIMTDGEENSSQEYKDTHMKELIAEKEKEGNWTFVYLGANQDSYAKAAQYGFSAMNTSNFHATTAGTGSAMRMMAANTVSFAAQASSNTSSFLSKDDQDLLEKTK